MKETNKQEIMDKLRSIQSQSDDFDMLCNCEGDGHHTPVCVTMKFRLCLEDVEDLLFFK